MGLFLYSHVMRLSRGGNAQEHHGLVWVWPVWGPEAFIESAATSIVSCPDLEGEDPLNPGECLPQTLLEFLHRNLQVCLSIGPQLTAQDERNDTAEDAHHSFNITRKKYRSLQAPIDCQGCTS